MGSYTRGPRKVNEVFFETLAGAYEVNEVFFETLVDVYEISEVFLEIFTPSPMTLFYMIGCHKEGKRGVFISLRIITLSPSFKIVGPTIYRRLYKYKIKEIFFSCGNDVSFIF